MRLRLCAARAAWHAPRQRRGMPSAIGRNVPLSNAAARKKYREDADYRRRKLAYSLAYRAAHKDEINRKRREQNATPKGRAAVRDACLKRRYGVSLDDYKAMYKRQRGRCRICRVKKRKLYVDHKGPIVRGLLCNPCNLGLGIFRDDPKRMRAAITYVKASARTPRRRRKRKKARRKR
jgi:hypothetical protein